MTYREALDWIYSFSDTERTGRFVRDREDNLRRERALLRALGDPQRAYGVTHIAGTKGKGSTAAMIAAMLRAGGLRVGLYTQPDLHTFRERIRVGADRIGEREVVALVAELEAALGRVGSELGPYITYEVATALAFLHFQRAGVEHAVIEVGLGGRLDATNVVEPAVAVITSISFDHTQVLGSTLRAIATEKAGIIKPGAPTVTSARTPEALATIEAVCAERGSRLVRVAPEESADSEWTFRAGRASSERQWCDVWGPDTTLTALELRLLGEHQVENAAAALAAVHELRCAGLEVSRADMREGLRTVQWPGRMQQVGMRPWIIVDGAHNADSMAKLFAALRRHFEYDRLLVVLGVMADKDLDGILQEVARAQPQHVVASAARYARALPPEDIATTLRAVAPDVPVRVEPIVGGALESASRLARPPDLICVTGSLYLVADALRWYAAHETAAQTMLPIEIDGVDHM